MSEPPILYPGKIKLVRPTVYPIGSQYGEKSKYWLRHLNDKGEWVNGQDKDGNGAHRGYDFLTPIGADVRAVYDGFIIKAGQENQEDIKVGFGLRIVQMIVIDGKTYSIFYGHLSELAPDSLTAGKVRAGQLIAKSGNSGRSSGPHLHVEARDLNQTSIPIEWSMI